MMAPASVGYAVGFEQLSSFKTKRHFVFVCERIVASVRHRHFMTATFRRTEETTKIGGATISRIARAEPSAIAGDADTCPSEPAGLSGRKLRNRLIVANVIAWIVIIFLIRLIFF
jgi:hypothetical protein